MCTGSTTALLYAWARNAAKIDLPEDVGFLVGGQTRRKYLVVQVHYMHMDHDNDNSGVQVHKPNNLTRTIVALKKESVCRSFHSQRAGTFWHM